MRHCPSCGKPSLRVVRAFAACYVECATPGCHWHQAPTEERIIEAALFTWYIENPKEPT